jgi:glucan phosphoethanolaminetransferase (alkaline phosphatase superfamily)
MKVNVDNKHKLKGHEVAAGLNTNPNKSLKSKILNLDNKLQQILLWSNICTLLACVQTVFTIARIYSCLSGKYPGLLALALIVIILLFAVYLYFKWKDVAFKDNGDLQKASGINLNYQFNELNGQRKLIANYLLIYSIAIIVSGLFFWQDINHGLSLLFKSIVPFNFLIYSIGFYFMMNAAKQKCKLEILEKQVDRLAL